MRPSSPVHERRNCGMAPRWSAFCTRFSVHAPGGKLTEIEAAQALETFRRDTHRLKDVSFPLDRRCWRQCRHSALSRDGQDQREDPQRDIFDQFRRSI